MIKGYIFDMDGVLIDSMPMVMVIDRDIFDVLGVPYDEEARQLMRYVPIEVSAKILAERYDIGLTEDEVKEKLYGMLREGYRTVDYKPGVPEYLDHLKKSGVRLCIATATEPEIALEVVQRLGMDKKLEFLVACTDVGATKEKPDVFIEAARRMGLTPEECAVFEDGLPGATSSKGAGFTVVGVHDSTATDEDTENMKAISDRYIESFNEIKDTLL